MEDTEMLVPRRNEENFRFGFNDPDFSDRVLNIEIIPVQSNDSNCYVESLHLSSIILAAKSPFFYKLFKNGMKESQSRSASLKISSSEKTALMDLLKFMYSNTLSATTNSDLLNVLIVADKFEVSSCMGYCIQLLTKTPMSVESAVSYLDLPSNVLVAEEVQPLIDAARLYLLARFKDFNNSLEDAMKLSLSALEFVLGSGSLRVDSEDDVFEFVLKWAHAHYPKPKECREIINNRLVQFICFPYMSCLKLKKVLLCPEFDHEKVSKLVMEALFYKAETFSAEPIHAPNKLESFAGHIYHDRVVKVSKLGLSRPRRVVYFDLKKEECESLSASSSLYSQPFLLGGLWFSFMVQRRKKEQRLSEHLGLYLKTTKGSKNCTVKIVVEVMKKSSKKSSNKFEGLVTGKNPFLVGDEGRGWRDVLRTPWINFMRDNSEYFIDKILRFRVDITINHQT